MRRDIGHVGNGMKVGSALAVLVMVSVLALDASGAERMVLGELFTSAG